MNIEMCLLLNIFNLVAFAVDCVVSITVIQLLTCDSVTCVLSWCERVLNVSCGGPVQLAGF